MLTFSNIRTQIQEKNYVEVPCALSRKDFLEAAEHFISFLELPDSVKRKFYYTLDPADRGSVLGYLRKNKVMGDGDDKEYFHYHPAGEELFQDILLKNNPTIKKFFDSAYRVYQEASSIAKKIVEILDPHFPGLSERFFPTGRQERAMVRFLKYDSKKPGDFLARAHYDRGGFALALAESAPGLRIGRDEHTLREVVHREYSALFMPAIYFKALTSKAFSPAWHDVVQRSEDVVAKDIARWAIVFFTNAEGMKPPTVEETHKPVPRYHGRV